MKHAENDTPVNLIGISTEKMDYWHPDIVGYYEISYMKLGLKEKPGFIKRFFMKHLLGFNWNEITK